MVPKDPEAATLPSSLIQGDTYPLSCGLVLTAAGSSRRMGGGLKKEYRFIDGQPVLIHTLLAFFRTISKRKTGANWHLVLTIPQGDQERVRTLLGGIPSEFEELNTTLRLVEGGETRQESVFFGLSSFSEAMDYVLIHDAARPWVSEKLIISVIEDVVAHGGCIPVVPIADAVKKINSDGFIEEHAERPHIRGAQTPQAFAYPAILEAHRKAREEGKSCIDDSELYHRYIGPVHTVEGEPENRKITFPRDLEGKTGAPKKENEENSWRMA